MKISVCMATYNGEKYIKEQLESILVQIGDNDEVIISDDNSTDKTLEIIKGFVDRRIKLFDNKNYSGVNGNFENALNKATGNIIFLSDQDDIWLPNKVSKTLEALKTNDLVLSDAKIVDNTGKILHDSFYYVNSSKKGFLKNLIKNSYLGCAMAFNRKILEASLPFPKNIPMHDWWIGLISELKGSVCFLDDKLIMHRRHDSNASATSGKSNYAFLTKIKFRFVMTRNLIKFIRR